MTESKVDETVSKLQGMADDAYCDYVRQLGSECCLGMDAKIKSKRFGKDEYDAHARAHQLFGKHCAYQEAANLLRAAHAARTPAKSEGR